MANYIHWQDYYRQNFLKAFYTAKNSIENMNIDAKTIYDLVDKTVTTLRYFLQNNGIFYFSDIDVIRQAFYIEFLEDGDALMEIYSLLKNIDNGSMTEDIRERFKTNFFAFENLKQKFESSV